MAIAPTLRRGYSLLGTRAYRLPAWFWRELSLSLLRGTPRSAAEDAARVLAAWLEPPIVHGAEHIPSGGPLALVANHYQRRGLWIGFAGGILAREVMLRRADRASPHYMVIGDLRLRGVPVPGTDALFQRVAQVWGYVPLPQDDGDVAGRAGALRALLRLALPAPRGRGEPIGIFPEGSAGSTAGLREALPGAGTLLLRLSQAGVPLLPAAVWEQGGRLHAAFGPTFSLDGTCGATRDRRASTEAMRQVATLLPSRLRGVYAFCAP